MTHDELRAVRESLNLTQTQMGEALGVSMRAIQHYEAGTRKVPKPIALLATAMMRKGDD